MTERYDWWPASDREVSEAKDAQLTSAVALLAVYNAGRARELTPDEQARLAEVLEMQRDQAFTQPED